MDLRFFDAHNHLQDEWLVPYRDQLLVELPLLGVAGMVVNGTCESDWQEVAALSDKAKWLIPSYGLHPWDCGNRSANWESNLKHCLMDNPQAVIGEIGIDRWILDRAKPDDPRLAGLRRAPLEEQSEVFLRQLGMAVELECPASIHCLDAWGTLLELLQKASLPKRGFLLHAYGGSADMVSSFADLGAYFSFNGSFLDSRMKRAQEAFSKVPEERLLMETDAPAMMIPAPWRKHELPPSVQGSAINHPGNIVGVYQGYAALTGIPLSSLVDRCAENFLRLFAPIHLFIEEQRLLFG